MENMKTLTIDGVEYVIYDGKAIHFDETQSLTDAQKAQVRKNIGAAQEGGLIVTVTGNTASHTAEEILAHVQNGGKAVLTAGDVVYNFAGRNPGMIEEDEPNVAFLSVNGEDDDFQLAYITGRKVSYYRFNPGNKITAPEKAQAGQVLTVKATDEFGYPTDWEAVDIGSGGLVVTVDNNVSSKSSAEIAAHVKTGGSVVLNQYGEVYSFINYSEDTGAAYFIQVDPMDGEYFQTATVDGNRVYFHVLPFALDKDVVKVTDQDLTEEEKAQARTNIGAAGTADLTSHNTSTGAHADLRTELKSLSDRINAALDSDDATLDELSEIVAYIKSNKSLIDAITTSKVSVSDIVDNLATNVVNKPLSAAQGVALKALIDAVTTTANNAEKSAAAASTAAGEAKSTASTAKTTADAAKTTAAAASETAGEAKTAANEAKSTATAASATAGEAKNTAAEAKAAASAANITEFKSLTDDQRTAARVNISAVGYEANQGLNDFARHNARTNIKAVSYEQAPQTSLTKEEKAQARENIGALGADSVANKSDIYTSWVQIEHEEVTGKVGVTTGTINTVAQGKYTNIRVDSYSVLKVTGYQWDSAYNYALVCFFDTNGSAVSNVKLTNGTQYTEYEVTVPANAVTAIINGKVGNVLAVIGKKEFDCKTLYEEKANRIAKWVAPTIEVKDKYIIAANGKSEMSQADGELGTVDVSNYQKVTVTGYQYDLTYGFDVCCFYDASGNLISSHQGTTSKKKTVLSLDVPSGAVILKVTGQRYEAHVGVQGYQVFDVEDLYESLKPSGKKLITLGDSITALGVGNTGWVKYFLEKTGCELMANVAVNGATLMDKSGTTYDGNPVFNGSDNNVNNVLGNQVQKIINNNYSAPDIIIIAIGTNDGISITKDQIKAVYYDSSNNLISLDSVDRKTSAGAYRWCLEKLHAKYPNALIFWCTPIMGYQKTRSAENAMAYAESLRIATEYTGQMMIDTIRCGINGVNELSNANGQYLVDGLHPNANGAKKIGYYNAAKVIPFLGNSFTLS